jgi:hypothetical protein
MSIQTCIYVLISLAELERKLIFYNSPHPPLPLPNVKEMYNAHFNLWIG